MISSVKKKFANMSEQNLEDDEGKSNFVYFLKYVVRKLILLSKNSIRIFCSTLMISVLDFYFSVLRSLGVTTSQLCIDMMTPMKEEFVYEIDGNEKRLNQEIDDLLDGIDRYDPHTFPEENQHEQSERNEYIKSPIPYTQEENKNRSLDDPKDMFQQHVSNVYCILDKSESSDDSVTMTYVYQQSVNNHQMELISEQNEMSSPIIQPFICSEEKSSEHFLWTHWKKGMK